MFRVRAAVACAAAFAALAGLVAAGEPNGIDQWAIDHLMPGAAPGAGKQTFAGAVIPFWHVHWHGVVHVVSEVVTVPASFTPATVLVALACTRLDGRFVVAAAYVAGNLIEIVTKWALTRPALTVSSFDNSYPSGHTIRAVLVAAVVGAAWPRLRPLAIAWLAAAIAFIEIGGFHVPSDIAGGLLLAAALLATTWPSWSFEPASSRRPSPASRPCARAR
ncbi:MAG: phosphatase PAP2 family protein [Actinobacteria bacterium]|nr:phosphatase PAP2 family protein [Actinomycetota bacterium]